MKPNLFVLFSSLCLVSFLGLCEAHATLTLQQVVTGTNRARSDIRTGELLYTATGYEAPTYTLAEAQKWLAEQKAEVRKEIEEGAKSGAPYLADEASRESFYKRRSNMFAEIFQLRIDGRHFTKKRRAAFERYRQVKSFRDAFRYIRYHSVDVDRQPRDWSKPYTIADYRISVFDGRKEAIAHANRRYAGDEEADILLNDEPGAFDYLHLWGHGLFPIPKKKAKLLGQETIDNVSCYIVQFEGVHIPFAFGDTPVQVTYWIAPEYGFRTVAEEYALHEGGSQPVLYVTVKNHDFREFAGIWYPTSREVVEYFPSGSRKGQVKSETLFNVKHATFNISFPKDFFKVSAASHQHDDEEVRAFGPETPQRAFLECGPRSLLIVCQILGIDANFDELTEASDFSERTGTTMAGLYKAAVTKQLNPVGVKTTIANLYHLEMPVIAYVNKDHFLVVTQANPGQIRIRDPIQKYDSLTLEEFEKIWDGALLIFTLDREEVVLSSVASSPQSLPLQVTESRHHFGEAFGGQELKHIFTFTNTGANPVQITDIHSTCYCTTAFLSDKSIAPGQSGQIEVTFNVPSKNEKVEERVQLHTNSLQQPTLEFSVTANARLPLVPMPEHIVLGSFSPSAFKAKTFILRQALDRPVKVQSVTTDSEYLTVEKQIDSATGNLRGKIHLKPGMPSGEFGHLLHVEFVHNATQAP